MKITAYAVSNKMFKKEKCSHCFRLNSRAKLSIVGHLPQYISLEMQGDRIICAVSLLQKCYRLSIATQADFACAILSLHFRFVFCVGILINQTSAADLKLK